MTDKDLHDLIRFVIVTPLEIALFVWVYRAIGRRLRAGKPSLNPLPIVDEGAGRYRVPLKASFGGTAGFKWIGGSHNNLNPLLVIGPEGVECRVIRRRYVPFGDIEAVDVDTLGATVNLTFTFRGSLSTFTGNVGSLILAKEVLAMMPGNVPLGEGARRLLADPAILIRRQAAPSVRRAPSERIG